MDFSHNEKEKAPEPQGEGADTHLSPTKENQIIRTMLNPRRRWKVGRAAKSKALATTLNNMDDDDARVRNQAVANLLKMEAQNQADQHKTIDKKLPDLHTVGGVAEHRLTVAELLNQADYIEYLRERERDCDPSVICTNGHQGNGKPLADGGARNGH